MGGGRGKIDLLADFRDLPQWDGKSDEEIIQFYRKWGVDLSSEIVEESEEGNE